MDWLNNNFDPLSQIKPRKLGEFLDRQYPEHHRGKRIRHETYGYDHPNPLRLFSVEEVKGESKIVSGETVGSKTANTARRFWDCSSGHIFPPTDDLVRTGVFFQLDFYHALALVLKGEWEDFFANEFCQWRKKNLDALGTILDDWEQAEKAKEKFVPNACAMYQFFQTYAKHYPDLTHYDEANFANLIREMILANLYLFAQNSEELNDFAESQRQAMQVVQQGSADQAAEFWRRKNLWIQIQEELARRLLTLEEHRLNNANVRFEWAKVFGDCDWELRRLMFNVALLQKKIQLIEVEPQMTREELEEKFTHWEEQEEQKLERLKWEVSMAPLIEHLRQEKSGTGTPMDETKLSEYKKKCKDILLKLWKLLHPDTLEHNSAYQDLTEKQKLELHEIWLNIMRIRDEELSHPKESIARYMRTLETLEDCYSQAQSILANAGLSIETSFVIQGKTIAEQLKWLDQEYERYERDLIRVEQEILSLASPEIEEKRNQLKYPEKYDSIRQVFQEKIAELKAQEYELEAQLTRLLEKNGK